jgi:hypothetical protein
LYPEDGGDFFVLNDGFHKIYTAAHHRRHHSSISFKITYWISSIECGRTEVLSDSKLDIRFNILLEFFLLENHRSFENVSQFRYLGTTVTNQNLIQEEIKRRLNSGNACYNSVQNLLSSRLLSKM